ncbi:type II 3-dehydroquinate dehydratase [Hydrogenibacillus sp. N12]|uniref:type II 3-dehydroquinate dehydratase n=1 Tax=Hydrogenibacillus sp. N12 TaxID=2866627 RepID=UPI001C7CC6F0|nr:type II 3-dehydroquinate dehydratase [Hydrogenibacillus sp. N12]
MRVLVIHGPNLQLLGTREPEIYGRTTLQAIDGRLKALGRALGAFVECRQSNHEGEIVTWIGAAPGQFDGLILNPAAYTHTSVAIRDALAAVGLPAVEVHLSNVYRREAFRRRSLVAPVVLGTVSGLGALGYELALVGLLAHLRGQAVADVFGGLAGDGENSGAAGGFGKSGGENPAEKALELGEKNR